MSEMKTVPGILDVIKGITTNRESGRLEIHSAATHGTLLFNEGQLVDARLGSLSGFQAVNALAALRDVQFSFDHVVPASHSSTITQSERVVLKSFFGIEAAEMEATINEGEPDPEWNTTPEQVVPLAEVKNNARPFAYLLRPRVAASLAILLVLALGVIALRLKTKAVEQAQVATVAVSESQPIPDSEREAQPVAPAVEQPVESNEREAKVQDLSGDWRLINTVEKTAYKSFDKLQIGFRLKINQRGKEFTAKGEKFSENGQTIPADGRTPIHVTGSIDGDKVVATFVEDGKTRRTNGRFIWTVQSSGDGLTGTFVSTAANSRGRSAVTRQ